MWFLIAWLIGFLVSGVFFVFRMSGRTDTGFNTTDTIYLLSIVFMSIFWPIFVPRIVVIRIRNRFAI